MVTGSHLSTAVSRYQCSNCHFISADRVLSDTSKPCSNCGSSEESRMGYPHVMALRLLNIIQHFYQTASQNHEDDLSNATKKIGALLGRTCTKKAIYQGWLMINRVYKTNEFDEVLEAIKQFFQCDLNDASNIFQIYISHHAYVPEQIGVPIFSIALIENLFNDLLREMKMKCQGIKPQEAENELESLRSFSDRFEEFARITGRDFSEIVQENNKPFWDKFVHVRKKRNKLIHGNPYAIPWETCEKAYLLAAESVDAFSVLFNRFVVQPGSSLNTISANPRQKEEGYENPQH
jgi:hypothetical protein